MARSTGARLGSSPRSRRSRPVVAVALPLAPRPELRVIELGPAEESLLQRFFDDNPLYFQCVMGEPAQPGAAHEEIHGMPPAGWPFTKVWVLGYTGPDAALVAMANVTTDLLAPSVWHLGLLVVATAHHGTGLADLLYRSLESWARDCGASWLRLGVVRGNARAERFWERQGFVQTRVRHDVPMGKRRHTLRVMVKPLSGGALEHYLERVPRDRPDGDRAGGAP